MTHDGVAPAPLDAADDAIRRCLASLREAADAADVLGISTDEIRATLADGERRLGFPSDAYVLALVGGTGVGKSSLLNALAGSAVSPASVRRPTTSEPVAWIPASEHESLGALLEWLDVREVREHGSDGLRSVAILDLPDMDSVAADHRERVEALLPRVDAVAWVTDLEKYHDAVLHDAFLRTWVPRLDRQAVIVNKADRLAGGGPTADPAGSRARPRRAPHGLRPGADPGPDDDRGARSGSRRAPIVARGRRGVEGRHPGSSRRERRGRRTNIGA
jgi:hypothetical protein